MESVGTCILKRKFWVNSVNELKNKVLIIGDESDGSVTSTVTNLA